MTASTAATTTVTAAKHPVEDSDSWELLQSRQQQQQQGQEGHEGPSHRQLRHHHTSSSSSSLSSSSSSHVQLIQQAQADFELERQKELQFQLSAKVQQETALERMARDKKAHDKRIQQLWSNPGIAAQTTHGLMIDAGSTGSRLHVFEWAPRLLTNEEEIRQAVSGNKLSFPTSDARWTELLRPGLGTFATSITINEGDSDEALRLAVADYLQPLLDFARTVLHAKQAHFAEFPIFLRATAGLRMLQTNDRARVLTAVRSVFHNKTYCPFAFEDEQARVLSGEEEAIYDWTGVNFLLGDLLEQSEGQGTVINPRQTHGALDLGGASTQISFYESNEDIMSNLFKLQIGQAKHWNVYAHSFLFYGMNEAMDRFQARLAADKSTNERLVEGIYNPCMPGSSTREIRSNIHVNPNDGGETWTYNGTYPSGDGYYQAIVQNNRATGDFDTCMSLTKDLLHLEKNSWCEFAHYRDCSLAGAYQPPLPTEHSESFGEFVAHSNYYHVWQFLRLPERATLAQLHEATRNVCSMSRTELEAYNNDNRKKIVDDDSLDSYCFRSVYVFQLLHNGYGFQMQDTVRATKVINGHKVGWALGAMLYEINTMPWKYLETGDGLQDSTSSSFAVGPYSSHPGSGDRFVHGLFLGAVAFGMVALVFAVLRMHGKRSSRNAKMYEYEPLKEVAM